MAPASGHPAMRSAQGLKRRSPHACWTRTRQKCWAHLGGPSLASSWALPTRVRRPCEAVLGAQPHARRQHYCRIRVGCALGWAGMPPSYERRSRLGRKEFTTVRACRGGLGSPWRTEGTQRRLPGQLGGARLRIPQRLAANSTAQVRQSLRHSAPGNGSGTCKGKQVGSTTCH